MGTYLFVVRATQPGLTWSVRSSVSLNPGDQNVPPCGRLGSLPRGTGRPSALKVKIGYVASVSQYGGRARAGQVEVFGKSDHLVFLIPVWRRVFLERTVWCLRAYLVPTPVSKDLRGSTPIGRSVRGEVLRSLDLQAEG
jgi:hypothetical protein